MSVPNVITCLKTWGQTGVIPSRLARIARPRFAACGLDGMPPARQGIINDGYKGVVKASLSKAVQRACRVMAVQQERDCRALYASMRRRR